MAWTPTCSYCSNARSLQESNARLAANQSARTVVAIKSVFTSLCLLVVSNRPFALVDHVVNFRKNENSSHLKNFVSTSWKSTLKFVDLSIFSRSPKIRRICMKSSLICQPVTLEWFSIQILVNFEIFKLLWNISLSIYGPHQSPFTS